jgi:hypothetical protein
MSPMEQVSSPELPRGSDRILAFAVDAMLIWSITVVAAGIDAAVPTNSPMSRWRAMSAKLGSQRHGDERGWACTTEAGAGYICFRSALAGQPRSVGGGTVEPHAAAPGSACG